MRWNERLHSIPDIGWTNDLNEKKWHVRTQHTVMTIVETDTDRANVMLHVDLFSALLNRRTNPIKHAPTHIHTNTYAHRSKLVPRAPG
jgi:hypothetical protein